MAYLQLPDGSYFQFDDALSDQQAYALAQRKFPAVFGAKPQEGMGAAFKKGAEQFTASGLTGLRSIFGNAPQAAEEGLQQQQNIGARYADQVSWGKVAQKYNDPNGGLFSAAGEVARQIPLALAEQAPNIAASVAGAKLGAMGGTAVAPFLGPFAPASPLIGGAIGAMAPSFVQQLGGNVTRQQETTPGQISVGNAAMAAAPQAALDAAGTFIPMGKTIVGKLLGPEAAKYLVRGGEQAAEKLAKETLLKTVGKGLAVGAAAEIPTEVAQQMLERLQAGLPLTDADAMREYGETAYQTGLLAPIGAAGRYVDRGAARGQVAETTRLKEAKAAADAAKADAERKQTPEYLQELVQRYDTLSSQRDALKAQFGEMKKAAGAAKGTEKRELQAQLRNLGMQISTLNNELKPLEAEHDARQDDIKALRAKAERDKLSPIEALVGEQAPESPEPDETDFTKWAEGRGGVFVTPDVQPQPSYLQSYIRSLEDPNAAAVGVNTLEPKEVLAALLERPDLARRMLDGGGQFPGTQSKSESNLWKKELAKQLKGVLVEPAPAEDSTAAMRQIIGDREAMDRESLAEQMGGGREQAEQQRLAQEALRQQQAQQTGELWAAEEAAPAAAAEVREKGLQIGDARRTPESVKTLETAIDEAVITPTVARALKIGELSDPLNLQDPKAAARILPAIEARLQDLVGMQRQVLANSNVDLTTPDGQLTRNGVEMQRVEANLAELRRLQAHAQRALDPNAAADESLVEGALMGAIPKRTPSINVGQEQGLQPQQYGARAADLAGRHEEIVTDLYSQLDELARGAFFRDPNADKREWMDPGPVRQLDTKRAMSMEQTLVRKAMELRQSLVQNMLQEAAARREATGAPGLTSKEALRASLDVRSALDALVDKSRRVDDSETSFEHDPTRDKIIHDDYGHAWVIRGGKNVSEQQQRAKTDPVYGQVRSQRDFTSAAGVANKIIEDARATLLNPPKKPGLADAVKTTKPMTIEGVRKAAFDLAPQTEERTQIMERRAAGEGTQSPALKQSRRIENTIDRIERAQAQIRAGDYGGMRETAAVIEKARQFLLGTGKNAGAATPRFLDAVDHALERVSKGMPVDADTGRAIVEHINSIETNRQDQRLQPDMFAEPTALEAKDNAQLQRMLDSRKKSASPEERRALFEEARQRLGFEPGTSTAWLTRIEGNVQRAEENVARFEKAAAELKEAQRDFEIMEAARLKEEARLEEAPARPEPKEVERVAGGPNGPYTTTTMQTRLKKQAAEQRIAEVRKAYGNVDARLQEARAELDKLRQMHTVLRSMQQPDMEGGKSALVRQIVKVNDAAAEMQKAIAKAKAQAAAAEKAATPLKRTPVEPRRGDEAPSQPKPIAPGTTVTRAEVTAPDFKKGPQPTWSHQTGEYVEPVKVRKVTRQTAETPEQKREALKAKVREEMEDRARQKALKEELRSRGVAQAQTREERAETARAMVGASRSKGENIRKNLPSASKSAPETALRTSKREGDLEDSPTPSRSGQRGARADDLTTMKQRVEAAQQARAIAMERVENEITKAKEAKLSSDAKALKAQAAARKKADAEATKAAALQKLEERFGRKKKFSEGLSGKSTTQVVEADVATLFDPEKTNEVVQVVASADALPPTLRKEIPDNAKAVTVDGDVYLIADRLMPGEARGVVLHEVGVHVGMDKGTVATLHSALEDIARGQGPEADRALRALVAQKKSGSTDTHDEAVAYFVEMSVNAGVEPSAPPAGLKAFFKPFVDAVKAALAKLGLRTNNLTAQDFVDFAYGAAKKALEERTLKPGQYSFSQKIEYAPEFDKRLQTVAASIIAKPDTFSEKLRANIVGFRTQFIDRFDPLEKIASTMDDTLKASQMRYWARMYGQRNNFMSEVSTNGALNVEATKRSDGRTEYMVKSKAGANLVDIAKVLKDAGVGNFEAADAQFKLYLVAERAERTGFNSVVGYVPSSVTEADLKLAVAAGRANPAFQKARKIYQQYNDGLIDFAVQTGALSDQVGKLLKSSQDYVSFYRVDGDSVSLIIDGERIGTVGSLKNQPYLEELVGGDNQVTGFFDGALRNTHLLTDMALRNIATRNTANTLQEIGLAKIGKGDGPTGKSVIRFREHGADRFATIDTDTIGIPPELVVHGLDGIATQLPAALKLLGVPARMLRHFIVRNPVYAFRQVFRDSVANVLMTGADFTPVLGPMKEIAKMWTGKSRAEQALQERGVVGGQVLTGDLEDRATILKQIGAGKMGWQTAMAKLDFMAMQADAASRVSAFNSYRQQGLSDMEATLATLETMNFNRRGVSPTVHALGTMIPFMNAQIQGLDVLYRAMAGQMPFNERLQVRQKFVTRGLMLAAATMAYAAMMEDDEDYKNASADERYNNWFVPIPGTEQKIKIPIPFEPGYIFKSLPEAVYNLANDNDSARNVLDAFAQMAINTMPGVMPQGVKPMVEALLNRNFFTGREIEDQRMRGLKAGERYTDNTADIAKGLGGSFEIAGREIGISPVMIEQLVRGYTGSLGMAILSLGNVMVPDRVEKPTPKPSQTPIVGPLFLEKDASGAVTEVYKMIEAMERAKSTFDKLAKEGREDEAIKFVDRYAAQISKADTASGVKKELGNLTKLEQLVRNAGMTAQEKRDYLDEIRRAKIELSRAAAEALR